MDHDACQLSAPNDVTSFLAIKEMTNTTRDKTDEAGWTSSMGNLRDKNESTHTHSINPHEAKPVPNFTPLKTKCVRNINTVQKAK